MGNAFSGLGCTSRRDVCGLVAGWNHEVQINLENLGTMNSSEDVAALFDCCTSLTRVVHCTV